MPIPRLSPLTVKSDRDTIQEDAPLETLQDESASTNQQNLPENLKLPRSLSAHDMEAPPMHPFATQSDVQPFTHPESMLQSTQPDQMEEQMIGMPNPMMPYAYETPLQSDQLTYYDHPMYFQ